MAFPNSHNDNDKDVKTEKLEKHNMDQGPIIESGRNKHRHNCPKSTGVHLCFVIWKPSKPAIMNIDPYSCHLAHHFISLGAPRSEIQDSQQS